MRRRRQRAPPFRVNVCVDGGVSGGAAKKLRRLNLLRPNHRSGEPDWATVPTSKAREMVASALMSDTTMDLSERPDIRDRVQAAEAWCDAVEKD